MQDSKNIQGKNYGIYRLSHLILTLSEWYFLTKEITECHLQTNKTGLRACSVTVVPGLSGLGSKQLLLK